MLTPHLSDFSDFVDKPKLVITKSTLEIQQDKNLYMNIALLLIVVIGFTLLYYRKQNKQANEEYAKQKIVQFEDYMNDSIIHGMLDQPKYNVPY
jgi:cbb3-type cytochrome oxidase subunit 3